MICYRIYCHAGKDGKEAQKEFRRVFPDHKIPGAQFFVDNYQRLPSSLGLPPNWHYNPANKLNDNPAHAQRCQFARDVLNLKNK